MTVRILVGSALTLLQSLASESVNCIVTSPPYYGLRDYKTGKWEGGDPACEHKGRQKPRSDTTGNGPRFTGSRGSQPSKCAYSVPVRETCRCGARRIDDQIGLEASPAEYVERLVAIFHEGQRVLARDGTLWLNLGDSYANDGKWGGHTGGKHAAALHCSPIGRNKKYTGFRPKELMGIPWMVAFALRADGWMIRAENIWAKTNCMPESVRDRTTRAHEQMFMLTREPKYYYDADAIAEPATSAWDPNNVKAPDGWDTTRGEGGHRSIHKEGRSKGKSGNLARKFRGDYGGVAGSPSHAGFAVPWEGETRNKRSVWTVTSQPFPEAHFATFPPALIEPCILAGCPRGGTVLDPFAGAGTTGLVAERHGRNSILLELNPEYVALADERIRGEAPLLTTVEVVR